MFRHIEKSPRQSGIVKWFNQLKGYGFIIPDGSGMEVFVHYSAIDSEGGYRNLAEGSRVEFEMIDAGNGPQARRVRPKS